MSSFYLESELKDLGFKFLGKNVLISRKACFYTPKTIEIGDNVRIDDFCIISGNVKVGSNIHISAYVAIYGKLGVELEDYTGISPRSTIYSAMDDFSGDYLIGPVHKDKQINVTGGKVTIKKFAQIGCNSVVFPNLTVGEGCVVGACSLIRSSLDDWSIYIGIPAKKIRNRKKGLLSKI